MKVGAENKKQLYIAGVLGFVALLALYPLYNTFFGGDGPPPAQAAPVIRDATVRSGGQAALSSGSGGKGVSAPPGFAVGQHAAARVGRADAALDPSLHMEAMLVTEALRYTGAGRNIFGTDAPAVTTVRPPVKIEQPKYPVRPPVTTQVANPGPPPKPPINLKFFGTETNAAGVRRALLLNGDDVFLASPGDVVERRYRVVSIASNSIQVEDMPNRDTQTLPLVY